MRLLGKIWGAVLGFGLVLSFSDTANATHHHKTHHFHQTAHAVYHPPHYQSVYNKSALSSEISRLIQGASGGASIGVTIKSMRSGDTLYAHNANRFFVPASTLKVLTAEAALLYLGPEFKFNTRIMTDAPSIDNGIVDGNLYLVHSGDPTLTYNDLADLIVGLKSQHIRQITGNVYIDTSAYDQENTGPGWLWNDKKNCYGAPISASIINHNCLSFSVSPGKASGQAAHITMDPRYYYSALKNNVTTTAHNTRTCYLRLNAGTDDIISVTGCMPKGNYVRGMSSVVSNVVQYNKQLLEDLFTRFDIRIDGAIIAGKAPPHVSPVATHQSKPLRQIVTEMLKKSDNIIAGSLLKKMGQFFTHRPGNWENGGNAVMQILSKKAAVDVWHMNVIDGSGLSRYNQVTPAQIMQVLDFAYHNTDTSYEFISALPIAGVDGTLKHRLQNIAWKVRAKTGTMHGVLSLAGYAISADKEPFAFVIMVNSNSGGNWQYKEIEDKIVTYLTHYSRQA